MSKAYTYLITLVTLLVLDGVWLGVVSRGFYRKYLDFLMRDGFVWWPAVLFYFIYSAAICILVVWPYSSKGVAYSLGLGAVLGLAAYGAYDLTNHAIVKNWPWQVTLVDLVWGMLVTALTAAVVVGLIRAMK